MKKVIVFDGRSRAALSVIRSLGKKGAYIIAGEAFKCTSFYSKYIKEHIIYPSPDKEQEAFKAFLLDYVKNSQIDLLIPVRDDITEILIRDRELFSRYSNFEVPGEHAFDATRNKAETIKLCRKLNVPHPLTVLSDEEEYNLKKLKEKYTLPILIKPRISSGSRGISIIRNWDDFQQEFEKIHVEFPYPMIQEFIPHGGAYGVSMIYKSGVSRAFFTHKRIREFPISGGPSTLREGVHYPEIEEYAKKLLDELSWNGVAMVEYRIHKETGVPMIMEINPRFWGSLETAVYSGVDFPWLLYQLATEGDCPEIKGYAPGKMVRWLLFGDILWFLGAKKNLTNIRSFFKFVNSNLSYDIFSWKDLGPAYGAFIEAFNSFLKSDRRKHAFKRGW
jgi:predicted ATP-grasp superfamily ATP-dependent carboligase